MSTVSYKNFIAARAPRPSFLGGPVLLEEPHLAYLQSPSSATLTPTSRLPLSLVPLKPLASLAAPISRLRSPTPRVHITAIALPAHEDAILSRADLIHAHATLSASLHTLTSASARLEAALPEALHLADPIAVLNLIRSLDKAAHTERTRLELLREAMTFLAHCEAKGELPRWVSSASKPSTKAKANKNKADTQVKTALTIDDDEMPNGGLEVAYALRPDAPADAATVSGAILADQAEWLAHTLSERADGAKTSGKRGLKKMTSMGSGFFFTWDRAMSFDSRSSTSSEGGF